MDAKKPLLLDADINVLYARISITVKNAKLAQNVNWDCKVFPFELVTVSLTIVTFILYDAKFVQDKND